MADNIQRVYDPEIGIKLYKVSSRKEIATGIKANEKRLGDNYQYDLGLFLGEQCTVNVTKSVKQPAGTFSITLSDRMIGYMDDFESLYGEIEPMDLIEIRMAHNPVSGEGKKLPVVMRGFVSNVSRSESVGMDGRPHKRLTISGHDYGKILQTIQVIYINNAAVGDNILHSFSFAEKYKVDVYSNPSASDFVREVTEKIIENFINQIPWGETTPKPFSKITPVATAQGMVSSRHVNDWQGGGSIYNLMAQVLDVGNGFNELFMTDEEEDVKLVFRPTPYITPDGKLVEPADSEKDWFPEDIIVTENDIVSLSVNRSDAQTANLFWAKEPRWILHSDIMMQMQDQPRPLEGVQNCDPNVFGVRQMQATVFLGAPDGSAGFVPNDKTSQYAVIEEDWRKTHIDILQKIGQDAVVFESGVMRLKGNEKIRAGGFITVKRRNLEWRCYAEQVSHDFTPYDGFFTTVSFRQGTGFINRAQRDKPYLDEMSTTDAYGGADPVQSSVSSVSSTTTETAANETEGNFAPWIVDEEDAAQNPAEWIVDEE